MAHTVTVIPGDGIGPEVTAAAQRVLAAADTPIAWELAQAGSDVELKRGTPVPDEVLASIQKNRVALKGPTETAIGKGSKGVNVTLRQTLDLYASIRPIKSIPGVSIAHPNVDLVVVRENTEGIYAALEHMVVPGVAESIKVVTARGSTRIAEFAFRYARSEGRKRVCVVHKANLLKITDGLFLDCAMRVAQLHKDIDSTQMIIDGCANLLARSPQTFDVLLMDNLYGDVLSNLCAGLVGGTGLVPGASIGERCAIFEPVHGSAPDLGGHGIANPIAQIRSAALMLHHLGLTRHAVRIEAAVLRVLAQGDVRTVDLGGQDSTEKMTDAVCREVERSD
ncbi:MAG: NAD-dependent isocitrate dehydrogenase [Deltaproteobacteria bacterium]|nr:NAD-dependent isocitrate dehydrogenase [Deltaproteobacteria bacterium]